MTTHLYILISTAIVVAILILIFYWIRKRGRVKSKKISFLIGSGFSIPHGMPSVLTINSMFTSLKPVDIDIWPDMHIIFTNGKTNPNKLMPQDLICQDQKNFFVEFIDDYCSSNGGVGSFNYENFFDYYYGHYRGEENVSVTKFCQSYRQKYPDRAGVDDANLLMEFHRIFVQLLASLLRRAEHWENNVHNVNYPPYDHTIQFIRELIDDGWIVCIHSLNHDLFLEYLLHSTGFRSDLSDGFTELGSPYYGELSPYQDRNNKANVRYKVRVKYFNGMFNKKIRLYKLHGSVDMRTFSLATPYIDRTRIKLNYGVNDIFKEISDSEDGSLKYIKGRGEVTPDFLSGTTTKILAYGDQYYKILFDHFKKNLRESDTLIIIGYGFWDSGINEIIKENFIDRDLTPGVISPSPSISQFYQQHNFNYIPKGVHQVTVDEYRSLTKTGAHS